MDNNTNRNTPAQLRLTCATCGGHFRIITPTKLGNYALFCPHCKARIKLRMTPKTKNDVLVKPRLVEPVLGEPLKVKDKVYVIRRRAIVFRPYKAICPDCGSDIALLPKQAGKLLTAKCKNCQSMILYKAVENPDNNIPPGSVI
ncbi:MAG: hypothetical protein IKX31_09970 [Muribaculaceae bacterium]|nr:hypothetical protein [Muribaculaceae bacterium]